VCIRTDQAVISNPGGMTRCAPDHRVLKDDAVCANFDRAAFRYKACAKHNPAIRANGNVAAHSRGRRDVSRRINGRLFFAVRENHRFTA